MALSHRLNMMFKPNIMKQDENTSHGISGVTEKLYILKRLEMPHKLNIMYKRKKFEATENAIQAKHIEQAVHIKKLVYSGTNCTCCAAKKSYPT